jgi:natural product biosynthesis luciferase-like monooxygenase protein
MASTTTAWFVGEGTLLIRCAEVYRAAGHQIVGVASSDAAVRRWAEAEHIAITDLSPSFVGAIGRQPFDYLFSIVNLVKLAPEVVKAPRVLAANFHDGPLPAYAGLNAPAWALIAGERQYGVTWHEMADEVDAGRILTQQRFDVPEGETSFGLNARCYEAGLQGFADLVDAITANRLEPHEQDFSKRTLFKRFDRPASGAVLDWQQPAEAIVRLVAALDFGPYANPFAAPRLVTRGGAFLATAVEVRPGAAGVAAGTIVDVSPSAVVIATTSAPVAITGVRRVTGEPLSLEAFAKDAGLREGDNLTTDTRDIRTTLAPWLERAPKDETYWLDRLVGLDPLALPWALDPPPAVDRKPVRSRTSMTVPAELAGALAGTGDAGNAVLGAIAVYLMRLSGATRATLPFSEPRLAPLAGRGAAILADCRPIGIELEQSWTSAQHGLVDAHREALDRGSFFTDVAARFPGNAELKQLGRWQRHVRLAVSNSPATSYAARETTLEVIGSSDGREVVWDAAADVLPDAVVARMQRQCLGVLREIARDPSRQLTLVPLVDEAERTRLLDEWNATAAPVGPDTVHGLFEAQVRATPDLVAVVWRDESVTYRELNARANRLAHHLRSLGANTTSRVGICLHRSVDMVIALMGVLKAGAAYVPLDPTYPRERLAYIAEDAAIATVIADADTAQEFPTCRVIVPARDRGLIDGQPDTNPSPLAGPADLAYLIYTSGSTGKPKGVMIEHRNVANFFVGMDGSVPRGDRRVWLAVTSISFDISVLELFWTLSRGFTVVLYTGEEDAPAPSSAISTSSKPMDFSLFYFSADERGDGREKYRLLLDGARFGDTHGFSAVWTPERHFHAFGGLYPNPSVTSAAVAAITSRIKIRGGSCVLPLHHPLRVVEEWSVVDNLSNGRVGIAFASGWQPNDFILRSENYVDRKAVMLREIETVRALWRGDALEFVTPRGEKHSVQTMPRPVQASLPIWLTAAGNPETFAAAATLGTGVLTHLLGQSVEELAGKIAAYRAAWTEAGHPGQGHVVLMLHTLVAESDEFVREAVRQPLMDYLRTSIDLVKPFAESFPTFAARPSGQSLSAIFASLTPADYDALVEHSFERYYQTSGLFGRPETCMPLVDRLKTLGVDEIACLIDFGVATNVVLDNLVHLDTLRQRANGIADAADFSMPALIARHGVTHLQCTPSMARMMLLDPGTRQALGTLQALMVGGEALPPGLASELAGALPRGEVWNMYGPTETTVWSTTWRVDGGAGAVSIGRPIANTQIYIVDDGGEPTPVGLPGHLYIGGDGVARGYWNRPELTAERFVANRFRSGTDARMYFTGDLARYRDDGSIEFLGRSDQQVKIRGHRIELGEIEAAIATHPSIREVVVVAREDVANDKRLVAYVIPAAGARVDFSTVKGHLSASLPDYLIPSHVVSLDVFPLTPNNKIDRRALPAPDAAARQAGPAPAALTNDLERQIAGIWTEVLRGGDVGGDDNFFDIGGDSLLAAQVLSLLRSKVNPAVSLTDLFRFPTIRTLAKHLGGENRESARVAESSDRARQRQDALKLRRTARQPSRTGPEAR